MKVFTAPQIREADDFTIRHEPIDSLDLMERAALACRDWIMDRYSADTPFYVYCGMGNNGGDGLALTRLLHEKGYSVRAYLVFYREDPSPDCAQNMHRLEHAIGSGLYAVHTPADLEEPAEGSVIVDALFGTGLNRPPEGLASAVIGWINDHACPVIAIDMPSGLRADESSGAATLVQATHTLSFQFYKLAFLVPDNEHFIGEVSVLPIGLHPDYLQAASTPYSMTGPEEIRAIYRKRDRFSHKGTFGHALLCVGALGKIGAAVLSARGCLRSGVGLLTCHIPACGYTVLQTAVPEAMCSVDASSDHWSDMPVELSRYRAIGLGPGLGTVSATREVFSSLLREASCPLVLDADALNMLSQEDLWDIVPKGSLLTPHPGEFARLFGQTADGFARLALLREKSRQHQVYIVLKGYHTCISTPDGTCFFNTTGNAGMATGGSGDVLTGILTGLLAQGYDPGQAAILGVYLHGLAGDLAADALSQESLLASDIASYLGQAFKTL